MGVRTIGYRFTGDYRDLDQALDRMDARIRQSVTSANQASGAAGNAASRTSSAIRAGSDAAVRAGTLVVQAEQRSTAAVQAHTAATEAAARAEQTAAAARTRAAAAESAAAGSTGTGAEQVAAREVAIAEAAAAKRAEAELSVAKAAEVAAAREVTAAQAAATREVAAQETAVRKMAGIEAAAYREQAQRTKAAEQEAESARSRRAEASEKVGRGLLLVGAATAAGIGIAVKSFSDFDTAMSAAAAGTQATGQTLTQLKVAAIDAGAATQFSATEAADAITALGKAGISTKDILGGGLKGSLDLAAAGQIAVADAAEIGATALTQFGLKGSDLGHVADLLAAGAGKAQGEVTDLANALKYVGPVAKGLNISIEETTGVLAEFASQGIIGEQAGTSFRGLLLSLTSPSQKAAAEMKALGINLYNAKGQFIGMEGVAGQLQAALGDMSASSRDAALGVLFGNEQVTAARVLYQGGAEAVADWTKKVDDSGFAARQAARLTDNLSGDLERLGGSLSTALIGAGSGANGVLRDLTQSLTGVVNGFTELPSTVQDGALALGALAAATTLAGGALLVILPRVAATRVALAELGVSAGAARTALATLGKATAIVAALYAIGQGIEAIGPKAEDSATNVKQLAGSLEKFQAGKDTGPIKDLGNNFEFLGSKMHDLADPGFQDRFADFTSVAFSWAGGSTQGSEGRQRLLADFVALDQHLTDLVNAGKGDQAAREFEAINAAAVKGGAGVNQLEKHLPQFTAAADQAATQAGVTATNLQGMGSSAALAAQQAKQAADAITALVEASTKAADESFKQGTDVLLSYDPSAKGKAADQETAAVGRLADAKQNLQDVEDRIAKRKKGATDADEVALRHARDRVKEAQDAAGKAGSAVGTTGLEATYRSAIHLADQFTKDISTALSKGLDPQYVQKLIEAGPKAAGPVLREIVADHSGKLIDLVNGSEEKLRRLNQVVVEEARLTATAVASGTDQLTGDLADAVKIANEKAKQGAKSTAESIAKSLRIPSATVNQIASEFGIRLMESTQAEVDKRSIDVSGKGHISIETEGTKRAIDRVDEVRAALAKLKNKTVTVTVNRSTSQLDAINQDRLPRNAAGGKFRGEGGPTEDRNLSWISDKEWIIRAAAGEHYGDSFMSALNNMQIPRQALPGYADGGRPGLASAVASAAVPASRPAPLAGPTIIRVPVHESHTRAAHVEHLHVAATSPAEFEDWAHAQARHAERSYS